MIQGGGAGDCGGILGGISGTGGGGDGVGGEGAPSSRTTQRICESKVTSTLDPRQTLKEANDVLR